jgi:hypothetical protein
MESFSISGLNSNSNGTNLNLELYVALILPIFYLWVVPNKYNQQIAIILMILLIHILAFNSKLIYPLKILRDLIRFIVFSLSNSMLQTPRGSDNNAVRPKSMMISSCNDPGAFQEDGVVHYLLFKCKHLVFCSFTINVIIE